MKPERAVLPGLSLSFVIAIISQLINSYLIKGIGAPTVALLIGILLGNTIIRQPKWQSGTAWSEKRLLEYSVLLLGATITFQTIQELRLTGIVFIVMQMAITICGAMLLGKLLHFSEGMTLLMAGGNAVCGSSAIAAISPVIEARDEDKRLAVTLVNLMGTVLMLTLPIISLLAFHHNNFLRGAIIGGTVQSVGQVIASATMVNQATTTYATLFKILRIIMLVVVVLIFSQLHQHHQSAKGIESTVENSWRRALPWYVVGFIILCALNSWFHFNGTISGIAHGLSGWCEVTALAAIGLRLNFAAFVKAGKKLALYGSSILIVQVVSALILITVLL
ncbi:YeiH family protein [Secundilactobacillus folii]|uniref:Putative sulfate exporter family transporter n=1 Tax=Secundilactobacillus folii TaxID=2678357 RepID=A0A7X2XWX1_9LACO|nr:putative sulfate exporter family transporter [Secundilactobacillus folii]MTV82438.1 putative sulfate exporter family transporter [Secundilactobacillus folii]